MWAGRVRARARVQILQNSGGRMVVLRFTTLSARDRTDEIQERKLENHRVSVHRRAQCNATWQRGCRDFQQPAQVLRKSNQSRPTLYDSLKPLSHRFISVHRKNGIFLVESLNLQPIFLLTGCRSRIVQVEYQGQTRYTRILERNLLSIYVITFNIDSDWT